MQYIVNQLRVDEYQAWQLKYGTVKLLNKGSVHWGLNLTVGGCPLLRGSNSLKLKGQ